MAQSRAKLEKKIDKLAGKGKFDKAIAECQKLLSMFKGDLQIRQRLAELLSDSGNDPEAIRTYFKLAKRYIKNDRPDQAVRIFNRILKLEDGQVTFRYQASDTGKTTRMTLSAFEFIRRFLCHVLPKGFVKIRYYGFFSAGSRHKLAAIREQLGDPIIMLVSTAEQEISQPRHSIPCPRCGQAMIRYQKIFPGEREPP